MESDAGPVFSVYFFSRWLSASLSPKWRRAIVFLTIFPLVRILGSVKSIAYKHKHGNEIIIAVL